MTAGRFDLQAFYKQKQLLQHNAFVTDDLLGYGNKTWVQKYQGYTLLAFIQPSPSFTEKIL